jgi:TetR/AcrR family transcriptional repressor of nem operon
MRVTREQFAKNRRKILDAAGRLFRDRGIDGVGVDAIMKAAGLTHGAFYSHFDSKEELVAQVCAQTASGEEEAWRTAPDARKALVAAFLDGETCAAEACAFAALGSDVGRQGPEARSAISCAIRERIDALAARLPGARAARRREAIATWAGLVGTKMLARGIDDEVLSKEILDVGRSVFGGGGRSRRAVRRRR